MKKPSSLIASSLSAALLAAFLGACGGDNPEQLIASSKEFLAKNDNKAAVIQLKNALQANPNLGEARFLLGKALLDSGDVAGAEVELRKAFDLQYASDQTVPLLARALLASGQTRKLINEFGKTELTDKEAQASLKTTLSQAQALQGKHDLAHSELAAALAAKPDYAPALLATARIKAGTGDIDGANAIVDRVLTADARNPDALLLSGSLRGAKNDPDGAIARYREAIAAKPDFLLAHSAIISTLFKQRKNDEAAAQIDALKKIAPNHPQTLYLATQLAYQRNDFKAARDIVQQLLKVWPNNPNIAQLAGAIEFQLRSWTLAEMHLNKALALTPDLPLARRLLISTYLRSGQAAKAQEALQPVLGKIDSDPAMLSLAGETFLQNGDAARAEAYFAQAAKLEPDSAARKISVAIAHLAQGRSSAIDELEDIAEADQGTSADLALIANHLRTGQLDKALKAIDALEKKQPDNPATYSLRARTLLAKKDVSGARQSFEKALAINPTYFSAAASLAALDLADNKPDAAKKRFDAVLAADPRNVQALLALAELRARSGGSQDEVAALIAKAIAANPQSSTPRLALIQFHLNAKDNKKALTVANEAVAALPDSPELLDALGRSQQLAGETNQALATFGKLAGLQPTSPLADMRIAEIQIAAKNRLDATKHLKRALEIKPDLLEAQRALILLAIDEKRTSDALAIVRQIQRQRPREAVGHVLEGDIHAVQKAWPEAIAAYHRGVKLQPSPELAIKLHSILNIAGDKAEAERWAVTWNKEQPKDVGMRMHLGDLATARKDYSEAARLYRIALDIQPNNPLVLNNLAWVSGQLQSPQALGYAEKANSLAPNQPPFMDTLAMLLADRGENAKAIELLRKALELAPQNAPIQFNLAKVLIKSGQKEAARKELDALAKLGEKFPLQAEVARLQKEL
ncbi:MAG: PEP-CTERM system TPR-repeat protein PrsT [Azonexus sp.]|jgi:putative PEP-CTERM system TPR-repeat lipoprotein|uniref:XrtA/PEP-CTERM system TPR-repeat protein PrsT n=1 Tax=Azonexus sp. TaxID=1872668 RepID=UPI002827ED2F|nr:XrtA/PEP-CTERM system TPR-repeat protein PrsT [Azonexus sp.]MDR0776718.1 PEP-CTERM system TPR-repeat protein PrsT [Azonexus sp.]